ncbi:capsid protein [Lactobacillus sp. PFC-70]|uniref:Capsid protein n=1 Tax=Levilactobacillus namurensis TaxID=380393 RepID=A0AAW8W7H9_9LACO|nr:capsid protein [Levilactobacillus namurensis]MDT7015329.1 capsid protein [Levilactobacillus namurensis]PTM24124.1 capsid protein [Lactobacillus sp. PFC-70]HJE44459.1 capsid protein [Levilactobacillus namurensis]
MATINYAENYQSAIQQAFYDGHLFSSDLWNSPSNGIVKFDGAKHIKVPRLSIDEGRRDRARRTITQPVANYSNDWDSYELTNERYWSTLVDPLDVDESNAVISIANVTKQFNLDEKMPEMDREMFSKLYSRKEEAADGGILTDTLTEENILEVFDNMMADFDESRITGSGRILYVTPKINSMLKRAEALNRQINLSDPGNIKRSVYSLDDVTIKVVPSDLMQTAYDFTVGSKLLDDAKQIQMFLIFNGVQIAPQKYSFAGFDAPTASNSGNFLYYEQSYDDVFLLKTKTKGIQFVVADKAPKA